jgi:hypothetical protein
MGARCLPVIFHLLRRQESIGSSSSFHLLPFGVRRVLAGLGEHLLSQRGVNIVELPNPDALGRLRKRGVALNLSPLSQVRQLRKLCSSCLSHPVFSISEVKRYILGFNRSGLNLVQPLPKAQDSAITTIALNFLFPLHNRHGQVGGPTYCSAVPLRVVLRCISSLLTPPPPSWRQPTRPLPAGSVP